MYILYNYHIIAKNSLFARYSYLIFIDKVIKREVNLKFIFTINKGKRQGKREREKTKNFSSYRRDDLFDWYNDLYAQLFYYLRLGNTEILT